jgi:hypothetical protein
MERKVKVPIELWIANRYTLAKYLDTGTAEDCDSWHMSIFNDDVVLGRLGTLLGHLVCDSTVRKGILFHKVRVQFKMKLKYSN